MRRAPLIGILGGMGSLATVDFLSKLVQDTPALSDADHVPWVTWNVPQIPSRPAALAGTGPSPLPAMLEGVAALNRLGATHIAIPCNTAHVWFDDLQRASPAPLLHIADATLTECDGPETQIGLVATLGTLQTELYQSRLSARGLTPVVPTLQETEDLFVPGWTEAKRHDLFTAAAAWDTLIGRLLARGAQRIILACTEVPVALAHAGSSHLPICVDPNRALAHACIAPWLAYRSGN